MAKYSASTAGAGGAAADAQRSALQWAELRRNAEMARRQVDVQLEREAAAARAAEERRRREQRAQLFPTAARAAAGDAAGELDGPGRLSLRGAPRHDNDREHISQISVCPTAEEVRCEAAPYLPRNVEGAAHHLPQGSLSRLVDIHFRLLRHDMIGPIAEMVQQLARAAGEQGGLTRALQSGRLSWGEREGGGRGGGQNVSSVPVFRRVTVLDAITGGASATSGRPGALPPREGVVYAVEFDEPPAVARLTQERKRDYWESARVLERGSLVCIALMTEAAGAAAAAAAAALAGAGQGDPLEGASLVFLSVVRRDVNELAPTGPNQRPRVGLAVCGAGADAGSGAAKDACSLLVRMMLGGGQGVGEALLLQACGSFFSYEPVLRALQFVDNAALPLGARLAGAPSEVGAVPPAYLEAAPGMEYDLSEAVAEGPQHDGLRAAVRRTPLADGLALLRAAAGPGGQGGVALDPAQLESLAACLGEDVALVQGPPGCGKTFVGVKLVMTLLRSFAPEIFGRTGDGDAGQGQGPRRHGNCPAGLLPLVVISYTNHALDQLMEGLVAAGAPALEMVRMGARSTSAVLEPCSIGNPARAVDTTVRAAPRAFLRPLSGPLSGPFLLNPQSSLFVLQQCTIQFAGARVPRDVHPAPRAGGAPRRASGNDCGCGGRAQRTASRGWSSLRPAVGEGSRDSADHGRS